MIEFLLSPKGIIIRYIMSGGASFGTNIVALYVLTEYFKIYYLYSAVLAFFIGFVVSFSMMKYWTFQDLSSGGGHKQLTLYFIVTVFNLLLNTTLMYLFVDYAHLWYILAQVISSLLIAVSSFIIYRNFIFLETRGLEE